MTRSIDAFFAVAVSALLLFAVGASSAAPSAVPADVSRFMHKRERCDHFRGEEPYDAERRAFLERRMRANCNGTNKALAALKKKYAGNRAVMSKLTEIDPDIE